jgi:hypothetical protein
MINPIRSFVPTTDPSFLTSSFPLPMLGSHREGGFGADAKRQVGAAMKAQGERKGSRSLESDNGFDMEKERRQEPSSSI